MALNPRGIWRQAQLIWGLRHCHQDLFSLPPGSARLLLNPFLCAHARVCERRCACARCVTWFPGSEGRWGSHSHHVDWESRGTQGAVPRGKGRDGCWAGKNNPFPFMHLWSFQSAYQVVLEELRNPSTYYISRNLEMIPANADHTEVNVVYLYIAGAIVNRHKVWKAIEQFWSIRIKTACIIWALVIPLRTYPRELTQS